MIKVFGGFRDDDTNLISGYEVFGNSILCDYDNGVKIEYVKNIGEEYFSALFREAMAAKLASELALRIKNSSEIKQMMENEFYMLIRHAELNNEIEKDLEMLPDSSWISARKIW